MREVRASNWYLAPLNIVILIAVAGSVFVFGDEFLHLFAGLYVSWVFLASAIAEKSKIYWCCLLIYVLFLIIASILQLYGLLGWSFGVAFVPIFFLGFAAWTHGLVQVSIASQEHSEMSDDSSS